MTRPHALLLATFFVASLFNATTNVSYSQPSLPPIQTLNFDFGGDGAYVGDDGVISSPGGTYWNAVSANDFGPCCGGDYAFDEFGQPTDGSVFSVFSSWTDISSPSNQGPRSDGIKPSSSDPVTLSLSRVHEFHEMIVYVNSPLVGGFSYNFFDTFVIQPFPNASGVGTTFPGTQGNEYMRFTTSPPRGSGLGESPTITFVLEDPNSTIAAIQIRGRFAGAPEPSSVVLLLLGSSVAFLRRSKVML